ncbi:MAG: nucleoside 2-deoxyribosyltransferase [Formivibrio sp.]|nr:nucleoside 2-deoxyribosyltransferase [Formivibrio sp.]
MKIYLAGPGVFRPDCKAWGERLKVACNKNGLEGLYPLDGELPANLQSTTEQRHWIFANNCALIRQSDMIFADLRAFRSSCEPDSGTAFEVGFAHALGKPVWLWLPDCNASSEIIDRLSCARVNDHWLDQDGLAVENFGVPLNLMLWDCATGVSFETEPEDALRELCSGATLFAQTC